MDAKLLELLVCPVTKGPLRFDREHQELVSRSARLAYPVRDGIPVLLETEARTLENDKPLICTEKDAVKLWRTHPEAWAVPLRLQLPQAFWELLDAQLAKANANIRRDGKPA